MDMNKVESNLPEYKRKCENWLTTFQDWVIPRSEAPLSWIFWSGIFFLSSALRRKVTIPKKYLGGWECQPPMYMIFVGPAGYRKTTTARLGEGLAEDIESMPRAPTLVTQTALLDSIFLSPNNSTYLLIEEFSDIIMKGGDEMYEFLTSMFDGKTKIEQKTMKRGLEFADKPCITMLAATTPEWIANNMPEGVIGGGFASRVIWVREDTLRNRRMYHTAASEKYDFAAMADDLKSDLAHISNNIEGEVELPSEVQEFMEDWYQNVHVPKERKVNNKLLGYMMRKPVHVHKLAMILHFAKSDSMKLEIEDFKDAIKAMDNIEANLPKVFQGVGKNPYVFDMKAIVEYVSKHENVTAEQLKQEFLNVATPAMLSDLIQGCVAAGLLDVDLTKKPAIYHIPVDA